MLLVFETIFKLCAYYQLEFYDILARQAVVEMKDKMSDIAATSSAVIASVVTQLE